MKSNPAHPFAKALLGLALVCATARAADPETTFNGSGAFGMGYIHQSSDTSTFKYSGNRLQTLSAQFLVRSRISPKLLISTGFGILERHFPSGDIGSNGGRTPFVWNPYLVDADLDYSFWDEEGSKLGLTAGYFPYTYNPDVKNLGLYLLRGPVYPGVLISGFETKYTRPVANTLGLRLRQVLGGFEYDLLLNSETETFPYYDISPAAVASYRAGSFLRIGAGVNLSHYISVEKRLTSPKKPDPSGADDGLNGDPLTRTNLYVDTVTHDTTYLSFAGTKLAAFASLDPKAIFASDVFGPEDLKLYGEVAVIGLDMRPAYKALYGDYKRRMPVMVGFNFPCFRLLDHLSIETEWYGSRVKDDLARQQASSGNFFSPIPVPPGKVNTARDDWKWSVHGEKKIGPFRISGQIADDHSRPGGTLLSPSSEWETYFVTPTDFYWMLKAGYSF